MHPLIVVFALDVLADCVVGGVLFYSECMLACALLAVQAAVHCQQLQNVRDGRGEMLFGPAWLWRVCSIAGGGVLANVATFEAMAHRHWHHAALLMLLPLLSYLMACAVAAKWRKDVGLDD